MKFMDVHSLYSAGQLGEAVAAAFNLVKTKPADVGARLFLAELLCFQDRKSVCRERV